MGDSPAAYTNGAKAYPRDPTGHGKRWLTVDYLKAFLGACRANALVTDPYSEIKLEGRFEGLKVSLDPEPRTHPFYVSFRATTYPNVVDYCVKKSSRLYSGAGAVGPWDIDGIGEWKRASIPVRIYLRGNFTSGALAQVKVQHESGSWPAAVTFSGDDQSTFSCPVAEIVKENRASVARQIQSTSLVLTTICYNGNVAEYPFPGQ